MTFQDLKQKTVGDFLLADEFIRSISDSDLFNRHVF
jgi:hypothetical protein